MVPCVSNCAPYNAPTRAAYEMRTQVAIVGGGPGGSATAIQLAKHGITSTIIEKETFPRFHIGESLTEQSGSCLRDLGFDEEQLCRRFPVKHGVNIYGPSGRNPFRVPVMKRDAQGDLQSTFTWQVRRSEFDDMLLGRACDLGAVLVRGRAGAIRLGADGRVKGLSIHHESGEIIDLDCDVLVDASGQHTFLANAGITGPKTPGKYCRQIAIFSHFRNAVRDPGDDWGNTLIYFSRKYHWAWFIPLDQGVTSIGFVIPSEYYRSRAETIDEFLTRELREFNKDLASRIPDVEVAEEVRTISNYSYQVERFTGNGWLCVGDAHRFIDPLFSFGVSIALSEARQAAQSIATFLKGGIEASDRPFQDFEAISESAVGKCQAIVDGFWESTFAFGMIISRYRDDIIDLLAGHVWDQREHQALIALAQSSPATLSASRGCT